MKYPVVPAFKALGDQLSLYSQLKHEYGARNVAPVLKQAESALKSALKKLKALPIDKKLAMREPSELKKIQALRPAGPRKTWKSFDTALYRERVEGALLGRFAGCTLGAPVEFWEIKAMEDWAKELGQPFPPTDYWTEIPNRHHRRYSVSRCDSYTRDKMEGVPVDDDITYTLLGLLVLEDHGPDFTVEDVGKAWLKYLPYACTAERVALDNLRKKVPAKLAGEKENPYCEWIGADIRSDPWGYLAPAWPERAAEFAYRDAYLSHRRQGIYGEMFFSAAISAAFTVDHPVKALKIALSEIPKDCAMADGVRWALKIAPRIKNYKQARETMDKQFKGMHGVHTINNACLSIWGLTIGGRDFTKVISETVAMGLDNDCTAATAGSICGAVVGKKGIPAHWYKRFDNTVHSYLIKRTKFAIDDLVDRFTAQARRVYG
jgi:ADP-ribosylglycohydrolase